MFQPKGIHLPILYEDEEILVLNKNAELLCHPVGLNQGDTLITRLESCFGKEVKLVHRLDQGTSGIMVVAKTKLVAQRLYDQFSRRQVQKSYLALVYGSFPWDEGKIENAIGCEKTESSIIKIKMKITEEGLPSSTQYYLIQRTPQLSLLYIIPHTGRKHQIRLHLASLGYPIVGEGLYRHAGLPFLWEYYFLRQSPWHSALPGHGLHAYELSLKHPLRDDTLFFRVLPPPEWQDFLATQEIDWTLVSSIESKISRSVKR